MAGKIYETAIALKATISAAFKPATLDAAKAIERLAKETVKLKSAEKATEQFARLSSELSAARARVNTTSEALARLKAAETAAGGATKESAKWTAAGARELAKAERELVRASAAAGRNAAALHAAGVNTKDLAKAQEHLAHSLEAVERRTKLAEAVEHHFGETLKKVRERMKEMSSVEGSLAGVKEGVKGLAETAKHAGELLLGAEGLAFGVYELAKHTGEAGDELENTSIKLGTTTTALQLLRYAGRQADVDVAALDAGLGKLAVNLGKVLSAKKKGGGGGLVGDVGGINMLGMPGAAKAGTVDPFKRLGLSAKELSAQAPEEQVKRIADGLAKLKTHAEKSAAAVQIFGKGGLAMLPLLAEGAEGIEKFYAEARASGRLLSAETIENAKKFDLSYKQVTGAFESVRNTLGAAFLPVVTRVMGEASKWIDANREKVKLWAEQAARWIEGTAIPAIVKVGPKLWELAEKAGRLLGWAADHATGLGIAIAAIRLAPLVTSFASLSVNILQAGSAMLQYATNTTSAAAAAKALATQQAFGGGGGVKGLLGKAGLVAAAGVAGYEVGGWLDDKLGLSDRLSGLHGQLKADEADFKAKEAARIARNPGGAPRLGSMMIGAVSSGRTGAAFTYAPVINVGDGSKKEIATQLDEGHRRAKKAALDAVDERDRHRRRVGNH